MKKNIYIYTEIINCAKIGKIAIDSFHKHHNYPLHIYGTREDFLLIPFHKNNILIEVEQFILDGYKYGHAGTALLWESIIKRNPDTLLLHFDSDVIFREPIINEMILLSTDYSLIGPIRNYHHNQYANNNVRHLTDLCQTSCFLFDTSYISKEHLTKTPFSWSFKKILNKSIIEHLRNIKWFLLYAFSYKEIKLSRFAKMIHGTYNPLDFPTIDFFDPVMFDMIKNGAQTYHFHFDDVGGTNLYGKRDNCFKEINNFPTPYKLDFGKKMVHFSSVGSGMNFYNNPKIRNHISSTYVTYAIDRYALFCKIFYNEVIPEVSLEKYQAIIDVQSWY